MSTPDDGAPVPARRPVGERRASREEDGPSGEEGAPLTRREMKARGMVFTTELPVIPAPLLPEGVEPAPRADGGAADGDAADGGAPEGGAGESDAPVPSRTTVRERLAEPTGGASSESEPEEPSERTTTGRRPVVRPPTAARGIRRLDETGAISAVLPVVAAPVAAATADPLTDPGPTNVAASWESAVSMPAVVLGIRDHAEAPTGAGSPAVPRSDLVAPPIRPPRRESLRDQAGRGIPGTPGRHGPPEASPGWSAILEEEATSTGTMLSRIAASLAEQTSRAAPVPAEDREVPEVRGEVEAQAAGDVGRPEVPEVQGEVEAQAAGDVVDRAPRRPEEATAEAARPRRWWPESGALRFVVLVAIGLALGLLIVLIANGTLGSVFAAGPDPVVPGPTVPGVPPSALLAPTIV